VKEVVPVILCGGSGTRLWPLSRSNYPKQFINMFGDKSLFQGSFLRVQQLSGDSHRVQSTCVVTHEDHRYLALGQINELDMHAALIYLLEPVARNTAPALTLAALQAVEKNPESILVVLPADQLIDNQFEFSSVVNQAIELASQGSIVVLGVPPTHPETGYGYIQRGESIEGQFGYNVLKFVEKPNLELAKQYLDSGDYFWNAGIFVLSAGLWLSALEVLAPDIKKTVCESWLAKSIDGAFVRPNPEIYDQVPSNSIDYAVIEKCSEFNIPVKMLPLNAGWSDVGSWDAVHRASEPDEVGNVTQGDVFLDQSTGSYVRSESRLVAGIGLKDLTVIETADAVLVANKFDSQTVKYVVDMLAKQSRVEKESHRKVYRPWGWYDTIDEGELFKVKRIQVNPGASLSLQMHHHRSEHWVVVSGIAKIICDDKDFTLMPNQSAYIEAGKKHRLANDGSLPLEIIEVQSGCYLGEDDIVRFDDAYGRAG
jgi:mannose-1-phosphate guanylyltransferase/mannose-6-phosphate isomerase